MSSDKFNPAQALAPSELAALFSTKVSAKKMTGVKNISYQEQEVVFHELFCFDYLIF
jgi:hypothetical protein